MKIQTPIHSLKKNFLRIDIYQGIDKAGDSILSAEKSIIKNADIVFVRFVVQHQQDPAFFLKN